MHEEELSHDLRIAEQIFHAALSFTQNEKFSRLVYDFAFGVRFFTRNTDGCLKVLCVM